MGSFNLFINGKGCVRKQSDRTDNQKKVFHSLKLAAAPKNDEESRVVMTLGVHSKIAFSLFAASKLKKKIEKESLKCQHGAKPAGRRSYSAYFPANKGAAKSRLRRLFGRCC